LDSERLKRYGKVAATGGATGTAIGGISSLLSSADPKKALRAALLGGLIGGTGAPATQIAGDAILGDPETGEKNPNTRRGLAGGATLGALAGLMGTAAMSKGLPLSKLGSLGDKLGSSSPLLAKLKAMLNSQSKAKVAAGVGLGGLAGAGVGAHFGADEGMGLDTLENEIQAAQDRRAKKKMLAGVR